MAENNEEQSTLEERFLKIEKEQKEQIEKLREEVAKRDSIIQKYMTQPSKSKSNIEDFEDDDTGSYNEEDVKKVLKIIESKRR